MKTETLKQDLFERNLLALSRSNPALCARLSGAVTTAGRYKFLETPGGIVPAWVDGAGSGHPLHSLMDPRKEARRLLDTLGGEGFVILLGLGGGYHAAAALEKEGVSLVLVIDYDINSIAELLCHNDYIKTFCDRRFHFLVDPSAEDIVTYLPEIYRPVLCGGMRSLPLRARTAGDSKNFGAVMPAIENAVEKISADYSVQAHFGTRWFSNIIRNLKRAEENKSPLPPVKRVAVTAAGPSLNLQTKEIRERRKEFFLIASDTSLPCLLYEKIIPDAVVAIDCQHISYYHFMDGLPGETTLFMDLAGPPLVAAQSGNVRFFSGNHPLTVYISRQWRAFPEVDTSGGNVTYACVALAEKLGAQSIELFGADFSYPMGLSYAAGTYIHPHFEIRQNRLSPLEARHSAFLYRGQLEKVTGDGRWYYESPSLRFYRERLEEKSRTMEARLVTHKGMGAQVRNYSNKQYPTAGPVPLFASGKCKITSKKFLEEFINEIESLVKNPDSLRRTEFFDSLKDSEKQVFLTLLPAAASLKKRNPKLQTGDLLEKTAAYCVMQIERTLKTY